MPTIYIKDYDTEVDIPEGSDMQQVQAALAKQFPAKQASKNDAGNVPKWGAENPTLYGIAGAARESLGPVAETLGLAGGAMAGGGPVSPGTAALGAGLGYAGVRRGLQAADEMLGNVKPQGLVASAVDAAVDVPTGAMMEAGGQILGKGIEKGLEFGGRAARQFLGSTTGMGPGATDEAVKGSPAFKSAMRGKITGDEIVDNTLGALRQLKDKRAEAYLEKLKTVTGNKDSLDISPIREKLVKLLDQYGIKSVNPLSKSSDGVELDFSRSKIGQMGEARKSIQAIVDDIRTWGTQKGDRTAEALDILKQRLDDFYSESSHASQFVTALRNEVKDTIVKNVPEYAEMTKGYSEATKLIKDIETGLMLRKNGMTGRVTADATLRRLNSAMREGFELRKDLLDVLGAEAGQDLSGQVAGYSASQIVPRGLVGKLSAGSVGALAYLNPKFWPLIAASSPRLVGEFLSGYGKLLTKTKGMTLPASKAAAMKLIEVGPKPDYSMLNPASIAEGGPLSAYAENMAAGREREISSQVDPNMTTQTDIPAAQPAVRQMNRNDDASARLDKLIQDMEARKRLQSRPTNTQRKKIPVTRVVVQTADGEELIYKDATGKLYPSDPNM